MLFFRYLHVFTSLPLADGQLGVVVAGGYSHVPVLLFRYLHACTSLPLADGQLGVMVAGGYSHDYLNTTELYKPTENR